MSSAFVRRVIWTRLGGRNTRYTLYQPAAASDSFRGRRIAILVLPGNPGNDRFYDSFCAALAERLCGAGHYTIVCSVAHANHVLIDDDEPANYAIADGFQYSDFTEASAIRYNLIEQIEHKVDFCRDIFAVFVKNCDTILIGHSIGAFVAIKAAEILRRVDPKWRNVSAIYSLFPAVERMLETPEGKRMAGTLRVLHNYECLTRFIFFVICELSPRCFRQFIAKRYIGVVDSMEDRNLAEAVSHLPSPAKAQHVVRHAAKRAPHSAIVSAVELFRLNVVLNVIHMAAQEFDEVNAFDNAILEEAAEAGCALHFLYAFGDGWGPAEFGHEMCARIAALGGRPAALHTVRIDGESRFTHAFVIHDSAEVAAYVCDRIGLL